MNQREQVAITSRVFCLAVVFGMSLISRDAATIQTIVAVAAVGAMAGYLSYALRNTSLIAVIAESLVVALIMGVSLPHSVVLMPYLVVLALLAGLFRKLSGLLLAMTAQVVGMVIVPLASSSFDGAGDRAIQLAPWLVTTVGGGLLGLWARNLGVASAEGNDVHYESARQLLTQLRTVTRRLSAGLDSEGMAAQMMAAMHEALGDRYSAVFVNTQGSILVPLAYRGAGAQQLLHPDDPVVERCWTQMASVQAVLPSGPWETRHRVVFPLRVGSRMIGVAVSSSAVVTSVETVAAVLRELEAHSLRLDTALVFDEIRSLATADERQRLAREIHDGIAQDVASLGYLVDHMASATDDPTVARGLRELRGELSRVVADLRLSIFNLRSDVSSLHGLGAALTEYVRQVGTKSDLTVHLTLKEAPTRLAPAVEAELLRIAQEAITNARRHASARNLWVDIWTSPPQAHLVVRDDGTGIRGRRGDSYGISIMRERAQRINATLDITGAPKAGGGSGTVVRVRVADRAPLLAESVPIP